MTSASSSGGAGVRYRQNSGGITIAVLVGTVAALPVGRVSLLGYHLPLLSIAWLAWLLGSFLIFMSNPRPAHWALPGLRPVLFLFAVATVNSVTFSHQANWRNTAEILFHVTAVWWSVRTLRPTDAGIVRAVDMLIAVTACLATVGLWNFATGRTLHFQFTDIVATGAVGERIGSRNVDVYTMLPGYCAAMASLLAGRRLVVPVVTVALVLLGTMASFSRGGGAVLALLTMAGLAATRISEGSGIGAKRRRRGLVAAVMVLLGSGWLITEVLRSVVLERLMERYSVILESNRIGLALEGMQLMITYPLTGVGVSNFPLYTEHVTGASRTATAHNSYANFAAEAGIVGFVASTLLIAYPLLWLWRRRGQVRRPGSPYGSYLALFAIMVSTFLFLANHLNAFYVDAGYMFWFFYTLALVVLMVLGRQEGRVGSAIVGPDIKRGRAER